MVTETDEESQLADAWAQSTARGYIRAETK